MIFRVLKFCDNFLKRFLVVSWSEKCLYVRLLTSKLLRRHLNQLFLRLTNPTMVLRMEDQTKDFQAADRILTSWTLVSVFFKIFQPYIRPFLAGNCPSLNFNFSMKITMRFFNKFSLKSAYFWLEIVPLWASISAGLSADFGRNLMINFVDKLRLKEVQFSAENGPI